MEAIQQFSMLPFAMTAASKKTASVDTSFVSMTNMSTLQYLPIHTIHNHTPLSEFPSPITADSHARPFTHNTSRSQATQKTAAVRKPCSVERFFWVGFSLLRFWRLSRPSFGTQTKEMKTRGGQVTQDTPQHGQKPSYPKNGGRAQALQRGAIFLGVLLYRPKL